MSGATEAVPWHVPSARAATTALGFVALTAIQTGAMDDCLGLLKYEIEQRQSLYNRKKPPRGALPPAQHWVWMNGPGAPHWEIVGTGAIPPDNAIRRNSSMSTERESLRVQTINEAAAKAKRSALETRMSRNCWNATLYDYPADKHSSTCVGHREPARCLCTCHDGAVVSEVDS